MQLYLCFALISTLFIVSSGLFISSLLGAQNDFERYSIMAKNSNLLGRIQANLLLSRTKAKDYFVTKSHADVLEFEAYYAKMRAFIEEATSFTLTANDTQVIDKIDMETQRYYRLFHDLIELTKQRESVVVEHLQIRGERIISFIELLEKYAHTVQNNEAILELVEELDASFMRSKFAAEAYLVNSSSETFDKSIRSLNYLYKMHLGGPNKLSAIGYKDSIDGLIDDLHHFEQSLLQIRDLTIRRSDTIDMLNELGPNISQDAEDLKLAIKHEQDLLGPQLAQKNESVLGVLIIVSIILIGVMFLVSLHVPRVIVSSINSVQDGLKKFLLYLKNEQQTLQPIQIDGTNEFSAMVDVINENITLTKDYIDSNKRLEKEKQSALQKMAITDGLTGLYNKRYFDELYGSALSQSRRLGHYFVLFIVDVDFFKLYNDNYGHAEGDSVLKAVAQTLQQTLKRGDDKVFRLGGEEFGGFALANDESLDRVMNYIESLCGEIEKKQLPHEYSNVSSYVTISMGVRVVHAENDRHINKHQLYAQADAALYEAKNNGRNTSIVDFSALK